MSRGVSSPCEDGEGVCRRHWDDLERLFARGYTLFGRGLDQRAKTGRSWRRLALK
jgi:hypothetical protein